MRALLIILGTSALLVGSLGAPSATARPAPVRVAESATVLGTARISGDLERHVVKVTNRVRARHGCAPLRHVSSLRRAARRHSHAMARHRLVTHRVPGERSLPVRTRDAGYRRADRLAENVAGGFRTARRTVRAWLSSPGHRRNILDCRLRHVGVGVVVAHGRRWWTQDLGRR